MATYDVKEDNEYKEDKEHKKEKEFERSSDVTQEITLVEQKENEKQGEKLENCSQKPSLTPQDLTVSFWLSQIILFFLGLSLLWFFYLRKGFTPAAFFSTDNLLGIGLGGPLVAVLGISFQWIAWKVFSLQAFDDGGINRLLLTIPMVTLIPMFAFGAIAEELLLRGVVQTGAVFYFGPIGGVLITSFFFTGMHVRYLKKPVLFSAVFLLSLILGSLYQVTGTLWASIGAHFIYNTGSVGLAKKYYLPLFEEK